ncbi:MAG: AMIN domain-containing protein [Campylobacterota bacterium]|nr:AMIN domain-containing protein [Campylobacterota bacterium]
MKIIFISTISILLSLNIYARENPFEPTDTFKQIQEQYNITQQQLELEKERIEQEEKLAKEIAQKKIEEEKLKKQKELELLAKQELEKKLKLEIEAKKLAEIQRLEQIRLNKVTNYNIISFINAFTKGDTLIIKIDNKFKLKSQEIKHKRRKFIFDFKAKINFYTNTTNIEHKSFKSIVIGSHSDKNFFRIVVNMDEPITNFEESIDVENSIITIKKIK